MELLDEEVADLDSDIATAIDSISPLAAATIREAPIFPLNGAIDTNASPVESAPEPGIVHEVMPASFDPANRPFWIEPPNGTRFQPPETLQAYCTAHELRTSVMYLVASGCAMQHKGYKCGFLDLNAPSQSPMPSTERCRLERILPKITEPAPAFKGVVDAIDMMPKKRGRTPKSFWARSPDGKVHAPQNISLVQFCKMHELNVQCMCQVNEHSAPDTY